MAGTRLKDKQVKRLTALAVAGSAAAATLDGILALQDTAFGKLFETVNATLEDGGILAYSADGTTLTFTQPLLLVLNSRVAGGAPQTFDLTASSMSFSASGKIVYATVSRGGGTAALTTATSMPTVVAANQDVFLIAKRLDSADGTKRVYIRGGTALSGGGSGRLNGVSSSADLAYPNVLLSPAGNGNATTLAGAIALIPTGGVIVLADALTLTTAETLPANAKIVGRERNAVITMSGSGQIIAAADCAFQDVSIASALSTILISVPAGADRFRMSGCRVNQTNLSGAGTAVKVSSNYCSITDNEFNGVMAPSTNTGVELAAGTTENTVNPNVWTT